MNKNLELVIIYTLEDLKCRFYSNISDNDSNISDSELDSDLYNKNKNIWNLLILILMIPISYVIYSLINGW